MHGEEHFCSYVKLHLGCKKFRERRKPPCTKYEKRV